MKEYLMILKEDGKNDWIWNIVGVVYNNHVNNNSILKREMGKMITFEGILAAWIIFGIIILILLLIIMSMGIKNE